MKQLELFGHVDNVTYCMSLTSAELSNIRDHNIETHEWIKNVRMIVHRYQAELKCAEGRKAHALEYVFRKFH